MLGYSFSFTVVFAALISSVYGQTYIDLARVNATIGVGNKHYSDLHVYEFDLQAPIKTKGGDVILLGVGGISNTLKSQVDGLEYRMSNLSFRLGYNFQLDEASELLLMLINQNNAWSYNIGKRGFQMGGLILYSKDYSETFEYKVGLYFNEEFFGPLIQPVLGFDWQINDRSRLYGNLPVTATFQHKWKEELHVGLYYSGRISSYIQEQIGDFYVQRSYIQVSPYIDWNVTDKLVFQVRAGMLLGSKFILYDKDSQVDWSLSALKFGDERDRISEIDASSFIIQTGLILRFPKE